MFYLEARCHAWSGLFNHFNTVLDIKNNVMTFFDIHECILFKNTHYKLTMPRVNVNCLMI